ncbi:MAG: hypothetical protein QY314_04675 [Candidatus Dojkabacteria bacterium]|nr:MAG: hypothetical protein QY314_04675 [Candidatus Dojkabacteria bacterium]
MSALLQVTRTLWTKSYKNSRITKAELPYKILAIDGGGFILEFHDEQFRFSISIMNRLLSVHIESDSKKPHLLDTPGQAISPGEGDFTNITIAERDSLLFVYNEEGRGASWEVTLLSLS